MKQHHTFVSLGSFLLNDKFVFVHFKASLIKDKLGLSNRPSTHYRSKSTGGYKLMKYVQISLSETRYYSIYYFRLTFFF